MTSGPNVWAFALRTAAAVGLTGMLCCVAPMVLFGMGVMGGVYAISFADWFYAADGSAGAGAWTLRFVAVVVGVLSVRRFHATQQQCSLSLRRQRINLALLVVLVPTLGLACFFTLEALSSWYFDAFIVPAQQAELAGNNT